MPNYTYPSNAVLEQIAQEKMPLLTMDDPIFQIFPIIEKDAALVEWEQMDNYIGLQQARGYNGQPARVLNIGGKQYQMKPGVYGEFALVDEYEITTRRSYGSFNAPIDITELVAQKQDQLLNRRIDRLRYIGWTLLANGTFSVSGPTGAVIHTDSYTTQTYTASVTWATVATATPLQDFRNVKLLARGKSTSFGANSRAFMNQVTLNRMLSNTNQNDLAGKRTQGLSTVLSLSDINKVLAGEDLPQIEIYEGGYIDDSNTFQLYLPNGKVVVVGTRPAGQTIGAYVMTRNAQNPGAKPGPYMYVVDNMGKGGPREIQVHDGHNGGPALYFPGSIVIMNV